jgi:hypothetical protein
MGHNLGVVTGFEISIVNGSMERVIPLFHPQDQLQQQP